MGVFQVKVLASVWTLVHRTQAGNAPTGMFGMHGLSIHAFDLANENPRVAELTLKFRRLWFPAGELPNLHACTSAHVKGKRGMSRMDLPPCVAGHQGCFCCFFEHADIDAKGFPIPCPCFVNVGDANADLLNAADVFGHREGF